MPGVATWTMQVRRGVLRSARATTVTMMKRTSLMTQERGPSSAWEESRYLALINLLGEADIQIRSLDVPSEAGKILLGLIERCREDFDERFR
jgi:hypothetical protein